MAQLRRDYEEFTVRGAEIAVVGPEGAEAFARYWEENNLPFIGLPDPTRQVLKRYGQQVRLFRLGRMPAQALIDKSGRVRFIHYGHSMSDIPANERLFELLEALSREERGQEPEVPRSQ